MSRILLINFLTRLSPKLTLTIVNLKKLKHILELSNGLALVPNIREGFSS